MMDSRPRYKGICPQCGKEMWICKSIFMEMGINAGHGRCIECGIGISIHFNEERKEMDLEADPADEMMGGGLGE